MIPLLGREGARAFDQRWIAAGVPSVLLMENAGRAAADVAVERLLAGEARGRRVVVVCGVGNNGGDGFVVARRLAVLGAKVRVLLLGDPEKLTAEARTQRDAWRALGLPEETWSLGQLDADLVVDALFGTGLGRALEGDAAAAANEMAEQTNVLALDVPSGLDANTGSVQGACSRATLTVAFGFGKTGLYTPRGGELAGEVVTVDIGVPRELGSIPPAAWLLEEADARRVIQRRRTGSYKNSHGHVLIVGGSPGKTGAPQLSAYGALRAGAGLVTVATWAAGLSELSSLPISAMRGAIDPKDLAGSLDLARMKAVVAGPGLGVGSEAGHVFEHLARSYTGAVVFDADAFTWAARDAGRFRRSAPTVLTPHPAELGRILGLDAAQIESNRLQSAHDATEATGAVVVLKGAHTVIAAPGEVPIVCPIAEPVLGVAGSGDTLAGIVGALLGAGHGAFEAAWLGVWLHARAGQQAAARFGHTDRGILPPEMADELPGLFVARPARIE